MNSKNHKLLSIVEELQEEVEIEVYAKKGEKVPNAKAYKIRIDRVKYSVMSNIITGKGILEIAGKLPVENYRLDQKLHSGLTKKIELHEEIDLTKSGIERFMTLPLDQTDGSSDMVTSRRQFHLPKVDTQYLGSRKLKWETVIDNNRQWVLVHEFPIPQGYNLKTATAALLMPVGYPVAPLDMIYFYPPLSRIDGKPINATNSMISIDGLNYQRWSRHRTSKNQWRAGLDDISTHIGLAEEWLSREFKQL